jgi:hypothetical protein
MATALKPLLLMTTPTQEAARTCEAAHYRISLLASGRVITADGDIFAQCGDEESARMIVRWGNSHASLVAALKVCQTQIKFIDGMDVFDAAYSGELKRCLMLVSAALQLAKEGR